MGTCREQTASSPSVVIAEADHLTSRLLAEDLRRQNRFTIAECAPIEQEILASVAGEGEVILVLGLRRPESPPHESQLLRDLRRQCPGVRPIALIGQANRALICELFRSGLKGVFERSEYEPEKLCRCIECVAEGQIWARSELLSFVIEAFAEPAPVRVVSANGDQLLTPRERDVVRLVVDGFGNREVAQQLGLSSNTVRNYVFNIFEKLGVSSRAELILYVLADSRNAMRQNSAERAVQKKTLVTHTQTETRDMLRA